jgi:hypothetical protein
MALWGMLFLLFLKMFRGAHGEAKHVLTLLIISAGVIVIHESYFFLNVGTNPNQAGLLLPDLWESINLFWVMPKLTIAFFGIVILYIAKVRPSYLNKSLEITSNEEEISSPSKYEILSPGIYMVPRKKESIAYDMFTDYVFHGIHGIMLTRKYPKEIRENYGLTKTKVIWLSENGNKQTNSIRTLMDLGIVTSSFLFRNKNSVVFLDGLEYLVSRDGFKNVYHMIQRKREQVLASNSRIIVPVAIDALDKKEVALLQIESEELKV